MSTQQLLKKKEMIDNAKTQQAEIKGKIGSVEDQMSAKFKVKTEKEADKELKIRADGLDEMEKVFEEGELALENAYEWDE